MTDPKSDDDAPEMLSGPSLGADGRVDNRLQRFDKVEPAVPIVSQPRTIELAPIPPPPIQARVDRYRDELKTRDQRARSGALKFVIALLVLAVGGAAVLLVVKPKITLPSPDGVQEPTLLDQLNVGERSPMIISSVPTGAKVIIGGETVGETPWAGDNRWNGKTKLRIYAEGYKPWDGEFDGDRPVTLDIKLKR
ncbi:MAG: PEGA domain-containing protein [Archangium sp.]|nr:PEGA domain-containing protein [Archangium sp.]